MAELPTGTVTFLFTDIQGSTRLLRDLGPRYQDLLMAERRLVRAAIEANNGHELGTEGDSHFVVFAAARDAVIAAVTAQRAVRSEDWPDGVELRVRMGIHTGEASLTDEGYVGLDVHRAARIGAAGHGGQILVSATTRSLCTGDAVSGVGFRELGQFRLKDLEYAEQLFQVVADDLPAEFPPIKSLESPTNLPENLSPFIGRTNELRALEDLLGNEDIRLLTLTGPGGTGKTRLAMEAARGINDDFRDGVFLVTLSTVSDPDLVPSTIAQTLDVKTSGGVSPEEALRGHLRDRRVLLLLDNFEQLTSAAPVVTSLLSGAPGLKVLVTSRIVLRLSGEQEYPVPPLSLPDPETFRDPDWDEGSEAVELFYRRARAVRPDFAPVGEDAVAVAEICVRLDGLPLAIELAAARVGLLPPQAMLARLDSRLSVLASGRADMPARQRTLQATVDWSYELLDNEERRYFRHASVFPGGFTLDVAEVVLTPDGPLDVLSGIASLLDKSLLFQRDDAAEQPRFRMLRTIRDIAWDRLESDPEKADVMGSFARHFAAFIQEAQPGMKGAEQVAVLRRVESELDNLRAAFSFLTEVGGEENDELALGMAGSMGRFWYLRGQPVEGTEWLEAALERAADAHSELRRKALQNLGALMDQRAEYERAEKALDEALTLAREEGEESSIVAALNSLAIVARSTGELGKARALIKECIPMRERLGDRAGMSASLSNLGIVAVDEGNFEEALDLFSQSLALDRANDDHWGIGVSLANQAIVYLARGESDRAGSLASDAIAIFEEVGDEDGMAESLEVFAGVASAGGAFVRAARLAGAAAGLRQRLGTHLGPRDQERLDGYVEGARKELGDEAFEAAWSEGRGMTIAQAKEFALEDLG